MEKKISEMSPEELQDYALELRNVIDTRASNVELQELNKALQKRNNELFMKVEQQPSPSSFEGPEAPTEPVKTCEDFAKSLKLK